MGVKFVAVVFLFYNCSWWHAALMTIFFFVSYRPVIAVLYGLHVMPMGDLGTFVSNAQAPTNIMSMTPVLNAKHDHAREVFARLVRTHMKARSRIVCVLGDLYYEELDEKDVLDSQLVFLPDGQLKTQEDLEKFVEEHISKPLPLDRPQWMVYVQRKYLDDDTMGIVIWKAHHSLADGVSSMAMNLQFDRTYDASKLIPFKPIGFCQRWMVRACVPFYIPIILWESYLRRKDRNPLHDGRRKLTGVKKLALSKEFDFQTIKKTSRSFGITINELMIAALSMAMARLFKDRGDEKSKRMRIAVPANIRWK